MNKLRILLTGADGFVGRCLSPILSDEFELIKAPAYDLATGIGLDLSDESAAHELVNDVHPDIILHLAAIKNVGRCEREPAVAFSANIRTTKNLLTADTVHMVFLSSDYVFDGRTGQYTDLDSPHPSTIYGQTKRQAELLVLRAGGTVVRSGGLYGPASQPGVLFSWAMEQLEQAQTIEAFTNVFNSPTYVDDLALALMHICRYRPGGIYHATGGERLSRFELLRMLAQSLGADAELIQPGFCPEQTGTGISPSDLSLICSQRSPLDIISLRSPGQVLPSWSQAGSPVNAASH
ncbi:MAG: sugar nucleotide-binding protein [Actinobacteria bacterium]|nr:sugar nucleotide-binding protein [Actinomycetota bacterium]